ncbi:MAG: hypothetical protein ABSC32_01875 [Steroidobacteraceae bacterium]
MATPGTANICQLANLTPHDDAPAAASLQYGDRPHPGAALLENYCAAPARIKVIGGGLLASVVDLPAVKTTAPAAR